MRTWKQSMMTKIANKLAPVNRKSGVVLGLAWALAGPWARASVQLDIPPRKQWDNNNGYCGECSIQQCALYYGTYISHYRAREIIDPTQQQDVWVPDNSGPIFDALRLNYVAWNSDQAIPQYQNYLVWTTITDSGAANRSRRFYRIRLTVP